METTKKNPVQPLNKRAEVIHIAILRKARERREHEARSADVSVANRNLSDAWSR